MDKRDVCALREKYVNFGYNSLNEVEKLTILMSYAVAPRDLEQTVNSLLNTYSGLVNLLRSDVYGIMNNCNLDEKAAILFDLIPAIYYRGELASMDGMKLDTAENAKKFFAALLGKSSVERFAVAVTDEYFNVVDKSILAQGGKYQVSLPNDIMYYFMDITDAKYAFISHCHPDNGSKPSNDDIYATELTRKTLESINVTLIDHIVVSRYDTTSMYEAFGKEIFDMNTLYNKKVS